MNDKKGKKGKKRETKQTNKKPNSTLSATYAASYRNYHFVSHLCLNETKTKAIISSYNQFYCKSSHEFSLPRGILPWHFNQY